MSRHGFFKVLTDPSEAQNQLTDLIGYGIGDWLNVGVAGYDDALGTFFFNMEGSWLFGTEPGEIPDIGSLQAIVTAIFGGAELPFNQDGLRKIAEEVETSPVILSPAEAAVLSKSVSSEYLDQNIRLANHFRGNPESALLGAHEPYGTVHVETQAPTGLLDKAIRLLRRRK